MKWHNLFLDTYLRTAQDIDWSYWYQCVDLARLYSEEVLWIKLGTFWGTARSGWYNKSKTFGLKIWDRIEYKPWINPPKQWDIIFYDTWISGHVAIVDKANKIDITVLEQNWATGNGDWKVYNQINLETKRDFKDVLWWYHKK